VRSRPRLQAHKKAFDSKPKEEQEELIQAAKLAAIKLRTGELLEECPSCTADGIVSGTKVKEFAEKYEDEELKMDVQYLAAGFNCPSCGLYLKGVEEVAHAGLDTHFIETVSTSLHDLYEPEHYQEYDNM